MPQIESLIAHNKKMYIEPHQTKSAKTQSKIPALTITFDTLFKAAGIKVIACDDQSARLINTITGVDTGSIKLNLRRINKPAALTPKEWAEILKGITAGRKYFNDLDYPQTLKILDRLEDKINQL